MGKLVVTEFITLDGVFEAPGGGEAFEHGGWAFKFNRGEDGDKFKVDELMAADAQLLGRVHLRGFRQGVAIDEHRRLRPEDEQHAQVRGLDDAARRGRHLDQLDRYPRRRARPGGAAQEHGDRRHRRRRQRNARRTLAEHGLVDEYRLMVFPIVLGSGKRLFGDGGPSFTLRLVESKPVGPDGVVVLTYAPVR